MNCLFLDKLMCYMMICIYGSNKQQLYPLSFIPFIVRFGFLFIFIFELLIIMIQSWLISLLYIRSHNKLKKYPLRYPFSLLWHMSQQNKYYLQLWALEYWPGITEFFSTWPTSPQTTCSPAISTYLRCIIQVKQIIIIVGTKYNLVCS